MGGTEACARAGPYRRSMAFYAMARQLDRTLTHEIDVNGRHVIVTDEPEWLGGDDRGPTPHELLAAVVAGCTSTMVALYARRHEWALADVAVRVEYDNEAAPRRFDVEIELRGELDAEQVKQLRRVAQTCPARQALQGDCSFTEHLEVTAAAGVRDN